MKKKNHLMTELRHCYYHFRESVKKHYFLAETYIWGVAGGVDPPSAKRVDLCFSSQDYRRNNPYHIWIQESGRSTTTHFYLVNCPFQSIPVLLLVYVLKKIRKKSLPQPISEHSGSIGICIKKGEKSLLFLYAKGAEGAGSRLSGHVR